MSTVGNQNFGRLVSPAGNSATTVNPTAFVVAVLRVMGRTGRFRFRRCGIPLRIQNCWCGRARQGRFGVFSLFAEPPLGVLNVVEPLIRALMAARRVAAKVQAGSARLQADCVSLLIIAPSMVDPTR